MTDLEFCERCGRVLPAVESDRYVLEVEALVREDGSVGAICVGCLTGGEEQSIEEDEMALAEQLGHCHRCGRAHPEESEDWEDWEVIGDEFVCPGCQSHADRMQLHEETMRGLAESGHDEEEGS